MKTTALLKRLTKIKDDFTAEAAERKLALLDELDRRRLPAADDVHRLHEVLGFLHAYPDNRRIRTRAQRMLARFSQRDDMKKFAAALADTGIEGTDINYAFYWATALWLETKWPGHLSIDWDHFDDNEKVWGALYPLLPFTESLAIDESYVTPEALLERLKKADESDAGFLVRRILKSYSDDGARETV